MLPQPYPKLPSIRTSIPTARLSNLVAGVHTTIKVSAYVKTYYGRVSSIYVVLPGSSIPEIPHASLYHDGVITSLRWAKPTTGMQNLTYGIYYGTNLEEMYESKL